ncbi:glutathionylspermidine synthase family protein [Paenibacillus nuruki]|uniref:glutathionylspermidine synthase family protein n=1 Tax=Paenibacillus nuruki TaxID=1886670 RepID=UPI00280428FB|nr:glutathionylspermidine synthase family protein [Paenibacillus nuruki]CAJ1316975.1 GSP-synth domain-containing protein [Paenibacillus nuruki]
MRQTRALPYTRAQLFTPRIEQQVPYHMMYEKPYCLTALTLYKDYELEQLRVGSENVDHLYRKTLQFVQEHLPDEYLLQQLGIHPALIESARQAIPIDGFTRLDWIISSQGELKCIENNTDTPSGIPEVAFLEQELLRYAPDLQPASKQMNNCIRQMFKQSVDYYEQQGLGRIIHFTSYDWHDEDRANTLYMMEQCLALGIEAKYIPLEQLKIVPGEGLYHDVERISILYRLYPLEYLVEDREADSGRLVGEDLLQLVNIGKLGLLNPTQHILTQSKGFMATIWSLYERNAQMAEYTGFTLFTAQECEWIEHYLLPTYFTDQVFIEQQIPYVVKGFFGREGLGTHLIEQPEQHSVAVSESPIIDSNAIPTEAEEIAAYYEDQPKIYQQLHPMEPVSVTTTEGTFDGYLLTGAFVIGGQFAGLLPRIGGKVTDNLACYCAAAVDPSISDRSH